ncbi:MAG: DUF1570 domain-containing protein [Planctomycetota bacterium]|nr:MAG: DUF1570 domain-containing protein [Planctomycetota bacterium]
MDLPERVRHPLHLNRTHGLPMRSTRLPSAMRPCAVAMILWINSSALAEEPQELMVRADGQTFIGLPIHWGANQALLLDATGRLHNWKLENVAEFHLRDTPFRPESPAAARARVQRELGRGFRIEIVGPYVLATPIQSTSRWRERFVALYGGFLRWGAQRGWSLRRPDFPLVVVEFPSESDFRQAAAQEGVSLPPTAVGCYLPASNRCVLYTLSRDAGGTAETEATVVHEAVHQLAFNTGVHSRTATNPLWFVEGLATMFEIPAVYDLRAGKRGQADQLHGYYLRVFQRGGGSTSELAGRLRRLVESDAMFSVETEQAYGLSWALTFYLTQRHAAATARYVRRLAERKFGDVSAAQRRDDFIASFGRPPEHFAGPLHRYFSQQSLGNGN